jgi:hypothetical protein
MKKTISILLFSIFFASSTQAMSFFRKKSEPVDINSEEIQTKIKNLAKEIDLEIIKLISDKKKVPSKRSSKVAELLGNTFNNLEEVTLDQIFKALKIEIKKLDDAEIALLLEELKDLGYIVIEEGKNIVLSLKKTELYKKLTSYKFSELITKGKNCAIDKGLLIKKAATWSKDFVKNNPKKVIISISSAGLITAGYFLHGTEFSDNAEELFIVCKDFAWEKFETIPNFFIYGIPGLVKNLIN